MFIAGQREMQQMDLHTMEKIGLPGVVLMENAGAKAAEEIAGSFPSKNPLVCILAGGGNNGGDGFVIARRLFEKGVSVVLCLLIHPDRLKGDAKIHYDVYKNRNLPLFFLHEQTLDGLQDKMNEADILVDAILGTGVSGTVREPYSQVISLINGFSGKKRIVSVDIPSGINSDNGKAGGTAVKADQTITFVFPKKGFFLNDGPNHVGEWKAVDISVPPSVAEDLGLSLPQLITKSVAHASLPARPLNGHKGTFGHVLVLGGSRHFVGAPVFTAKAALCSGAGLVTLAVPESVYPLAASHNPESLFLPLTEENGHFSQTAISELIPRLSQYDTIAIGPGMGRFPDGEEWMEAIWNSLTGQTVVIDADALYLLRNNLDMVRQYKGSVVFTPHPGEMARLINKTIKEVEGDRLEIAAAFAKNHHLYLLLKGHRTVIASPDGEIFINPHGHDALGKGGSGDILTGFIASFLAQGAAPEKALIAASYLHAKAGEEMSRSLSHFGVTPFDIIDGARKLLAGFVG